MVFNSCIHLTPCTLVTTGDVIDTAREDRDIVNGTDFDVVMLSLTFRGASEIPSAYTPASRTYALDMPLTTACTLSGRSTIKLRCVFVVFGREKRCP